MKITKTRLKEIIQEELENLDEAMDFNERKIQVTRIHDGFVNFLEAKKIFPMGEIPKSVLEAIMKTALATVDVMDSHLAGGESAPGEPVDPFHGYADPHRAKMGPR